MCNFHCPYCQLGGGLPRTGDTIPLSTNVNIKEIEEFIQAQVSKGHPVKVSGGEPTVNMSLAVHLLEYIKTCGGYACADTSGWSPDATRILSGIADQVAIDLKGSPRYVTKVTGVGLEECWFPVLESVQIAAESDTILEIRTVFFDFTTAEDLRMLAEVIPPRSFWLIRRFLMDWVPFDKYAKAIYPGFQSEAVKYPQWLTSPSIQKMREVIQEALANSAIADDKCILLFNSPRDSMGELYCRDNSILRDIGGAETYKNV
jgi:hypothetical protein